jgi:hypothetical protein
VPSRRGLPRKTHLQIEKRRSKLRRLSVTFGRSRS